MTDLIVYCSNNLFEIEIPLFDNKFSKRDITFILIEVYMYVYFVIERSLFIRR